MTPSFSYTATILPSFSNMIHKLHRFQGSNPSLTPISHTNMIHKLHTLQKIINYIRSKRLYTTILSDANMIHRVRELPTPISYILLDASRGRACKRLRIGPIFFHRQKIMIMVKYPKSSMIFILSSIHQPELGQRGYGDAAAF